MRRFGKFGGQLKHFFKFWSASVLGWNAFGSICPKKMPFVHCFWGPSLNEMGIRRILSDSWKSQIWYFRFAASWGPPPPQTGPRGISWHTRWFHIPTFSSYHSRAKIFTEIFLFLDELQVSSVHGNPSYSGKGYSTVNLYSTRPISSNWDMCFWI